MFSMPLSIFLDLQLANGSRCHIACGGINHVPVAIHYVFLDTIFDI
jgi:hypothetical protein